jgi:cell division protein FtsZ
MVDDIMSFDLPIQESSIIKVIGVGGGGGNAVNHMFSTGIQDVDFLICNTDAQALQRSPVTHKIQIGSTLTEGRGAGNKPDIGRKAAIESLPEIEEILSHNTKMVFITAGMGGGTGTGAAPVIAECAKKMDILTVAIVTIPFRFEGALRINQAIEGLNELQQHVDSLLVINNEKLREIYGDLKISQAFSKADNVLATAAKGIAEIITVPGYINVDFADVQTVMRNSGVALMGSGVASGENRALKAIEGALNSPLLNNNEITGAKSILLNITSGSDEISMDEIGEITDYVNRSISKHALIIWGTCSDESLGDAISVTIIATGFEAHSIPELYIQKKLKTDKVELEDIKKPKTSFNEEFHVVDKDPASKKEEHGSLFNFGVKQKENGQLMLFDKEETAQKPDNKAQKIVEKVREQRKNYAYIREKGINVTSENENIDELENEPAYLRKKIKIDNTTRISQESKISKFSLEEGEDERFAKLKSNNSYLHDRVD